VTALQDWLSFSPVTPESVKNFVYGPLRSVLPVKRDDSYELRLLQPGLERC
jgi:hypothetical protein